MKTTSNLLPNKHLFGTLYRLTSFVTFTVNSRQVSFLSGEILLYLGIVPSENNDRYLYGSYSSVFLTCNGDMLHSPQRYDWVDDAIRSNILAAIA